MIDARAAVLLHAGSTPELTAVQIREPQGDEVLVGIDAVGICHTDISTAARWPEKRLPMVFGHEGAGTVLAAGPDARVDVGRQVVLTFASCSRCAACTSDTPAYCDNATRLNMAGDRGDEASALRLDGQPVRGGFFGQSSFATHALANTSNVVVLPEGIDAALAAPLACSVQTGVGAVLNTLAAGPDDVLVVWGAGAVGLSAVMGALWLSTVPPTNAVVAQIFGVQYMSMLGGFVFFSHQIGSFMGVWLGGYLYDRTGSYDVVWVVDSDGEFARSLPYRTVLPRPVVGDAGQLFRALARSLVGLEIGRASCRERVSSPV